MKTRNSLVVMLAIALILPVATLVIARGAGAGRNVPPRPEGPGDIYAAGGCPLVAAHSTTRALYASYNGPLYQVLRQSDGKTLDIGVVQPSPGDAGGYADAAAQDEFCANTYCWIATIYDQSGKGNHITQAPRGPAGTPMVMGGFNALPVADWAPVTIMGHKVYGTFIVPGMGLRDDDPVGTAVDDQAEGQYWVINGHHYNGGCCFDYGNGEISSRDDGNGTMETTYFGNATNWYRGLAPGPWIMTDQENNLVGCVNPDGSKDCPDLPIISWRFVTATADGEPHHWRTMGGDAQRGELSVQFDGGRVNNTYDPMRKQGAIILGNGGDNSNGSQGTFYEGAMTAAGTMPTKELNQKIQANIVAAKYDVQRLSIAPASAVATPPGLQTFSLGSSQDTTVTFTNTTGVHVSNVNLGINAPAGWNVVAITSPNISGSVAPGQTVSATFKVTSGPTAFNGDLVGNASWRNTATGQTQSEIAIEKVRNVSPIKINEFSNSFVELYNNGDSEVDISNWTMTEHPMSMPIFSSVKIPAGTKLASKGFYVLGLSNSGLAVPSQKGDTTLYVRSVAGMNVGDTIQIDTGSAMETRKIASIGTAAGASTTLWQPLPDGPVITIPPGSTNVPFTPVGRGGGGGLAVEAGQKLALGYGAKHPSVAGEVEKYEVVTVTASGTPSGQGYLATEAKAGDTNIKVYLVTASISSIAVGDKIRLDVDSVGHGIETVTVTNVGTAARYNPNNVRSGDPGTGLDLAEPLKFNHSANLPFSVRGSGISFEPATKFVHTSNEPILPLGTGITLDKPLENDHAIDIVVRNEKVTTDGYQGKPNHWFGGPAISTSGGSIVLRDASGLVADSLNYGRVFDPWAAEGYQATSPGNGCIAPTPGSVGRGGFGGQAAGSPDRSTGRYPDGTDTESNCNDFMVQSGGISLSIGSPVGANNIKVANVSGFSAGQTINIDTGENKETAVITSVGTSGGTTIGTATEAGATVITVADVTGFTAGQTITIDSGSNSETTVVASTTGGFGRGGRNSRGGMMPGGMMGGGARGSRGGQNVQAPAITITVNAPLKSAHAVGAQVSGTGITFTKALTKAHETGAIVGSSEPTPGVPNQYNRRM